MEDVGHERTLWEPRRGFCRRWNIRMVSGRGQGRKRKTHVKCIRCRVAEGFVWRAVVWGGVEARAHEANKTEGARVVEAGVMSPVEGVWSDPTRRVGPYPSHSKAMEESSDSGQQSQSIAWARWSGEMSNSSQ